MEKHSVPGQDPGNPDLPASTECSKFRLFFSPACLVPAGILLQSFVQHQIVQRKRVQIIMLKPAGRFSEISSITVLGISRKGIPVYILQREVSAINIPVNPSSLRALVQHEVGYLPAAYIPECEAFTHEFQAAFPADFPQHRICGPVIVASGLESRIPAPCSHMASA